MASIISKERAAGYTRHVVEVDGRKRRVIDNDDEVARMVRGKTHIELEALAKQRGLLDRWNGWRAAGTNNGGMSMNLRNAIRHQLRVEASGAAA